MKTLLSFLMSSLLVVSGFAQYNQRQYGYAQTVTIHMDNSYGNSGYQVLVDGTNYSTNTNNNGSWNRNTGNTYGDIVLTNLQPGQHTLQVYRVRNNNYGNNNAYPLTSINFMVRQGY